MLRQPHRLRLTAGLAAATAIVAPAVAAGSAVDAVTAVSAPTSHHGGHTGRGFRQTAAAYREKSVKNLAPGVRLARYTSNPHGRRAVSDVLSINLGQAGVSAGILCGTVTQTASVASWAKGSKAVAAVNGDYFDITSSQAPNGTVIRGGRILKGSRAGQQVIGQGLDGRMRVGEVYLNNSVSWGRGKSAPVDYYNTQLSHQILPDNGLVVLDREWGSAPLTVPGVRGKVAVIAVGANHKVLSTSKKIKGQRVPADGMLIIATGSEAKLGRLRRGTVVRERVGMRTSAPAAFSWGLGYGLTLMRRLSVVHNWPNDSDPRDARTAVGWKDGGRTMVLVVVEMGRGSAGEDVNEIADELAAMGATDGVLLDGGGSTTLVDRTRNHVGQVGPVATPRGAERHVPIAIGVFVTRH